jgi:hypothetical protein
MLNTFLNEQKFIDHFLSFHTWIFEIFHINAFLLHINKDFVQLLLISDKIDLLITFHCKYFQKFLNLYFFISDKIPL